MDNGIDHERKNTQTPEGALMSQQKKNNFARVTVARALMGTILSAAVAAGVHAQEPKSAPAGNASGAAAVGADNAKPTSNAAGVVADGVNEEGRLMLMVNKSQIVTTKQPYKTVNISNADIADYNRVNDNEILVTAKKPGNTQLILWDVSGVSQKVDVTVMSDLEALQAQLDKIFPGAGIQATNVNGTIALRGRVKSLDVAQQAIAVAEPYCDKVLNFLEIAGGQQVMLRVRFAEVSRTASSQLGFAGNFRDGTMQLGAINGPNGSPIGAVANREEFFLNPAVNLFGGGQVGGTAFEFFVQALRRNNLLRVLAEPNVIAISGQQASFLAGGEFPVPVPQSGGDGGDTITIEYKQFGVKLNFEPTVLGDGKIRLKVEPEVSDLDYSRSVSFKGFTIPGLTKRTLTTTIELNEGQSFAVAGLLNNRIVANKDVTPLLGDLPIVGTLFRSVRYERSETELVVIVTPSLVSPLNPDQIGDLPGERWKDPTELQLFLDQKIGATGSRHPKKKDSAHAAAKKADTATAGAEPTTDEEMTTEEGEVAVTDGAPVADDAGTEDSETSIDEAATDEESAAATSQEPARFRGQYGFVPATN
jgi:pilus assembly protein CpaC